MDLNRVTPVGILGHHYWYQNKLGLYRSAAVTATYKLTTVSCLNLRNLIYQAVANVLEVHSPLSFGLIQPNPQSPPLFIRLQEIKLSDVIEFHDIELNQEFHSQGNGKTVDERLDDILAERISIEHARIWTQTDVKPIWRCVVFDYRERDFTTPASTSRFDIAFIFHHAIADGLSGLTFQQTLQTTISQILSQGIQSNPGLTSYIVPHIIQPPIPIEQLININFTKTPICQLSNQNNDFWSASKSSLSNPNTYKSQTRLLSIPREILNSILKKCRTEKIRLTGLLHGITVTTLARNLLAAPGFRAITPCSLRPFISPTPSKNSGFGCYISDMTSYFGTNSSSRLRATTTGSRDEEDIILKIARDFKNEIHAELKNMSVGNIRNLIDTAAVLESGLDYEGYCLGKLGEKRSHSYELSNLGEFASAGGEVTGDGDGREVDGNGLELEKLVFTQCGMVTGAAIGISVVSVRGGPFVASFTWQEGVVEVEVLERAVRGIREGLMRLGDDG